MATPPLTDQERALLAQFVATHAKGAGDAPILIQYALDRLAKQPGSTLAEVISALSPNGLDASVDYGPYLDAVNQKLGPATPAPFAGQGGPNSNSRSDPFSRTGPSVESLKPLIPGQGEDLSGLIAALTGQPPGKVAPSHVRVASLDPLPQATPAPNIAPVVRQPVVQPTAPASSIPIFEPPLPTRAAPVVQPTPLPPIPPARNPIDDVRLPPATPQHVSPPRSTAIAPTGPFGKDVPGPNGATVPNKDATRLAPAPAALAQKLAPEDLISRTMASLPNAGPFAMPNSGDDLALNPVRGVDTSQFAAFDAPANRLDGPVKAAAGKQVVAPQPAMPSQNMRLSRQPAAGNVQLSDADRELLTRAVATEVDPRVAQRNPAAFQLQAERVVDVMLNRLASDQFPQTAAEMLNQRNQFSAINGPVGRPGIENIPATRADPALRDILTAYLDDRTSGRLPSSVKGAVNYANPVASDASNLGWVNGLDIAVDDAGPFSHRYGVADGMRPAEATFGNPASNPFNFLSGGVMGAFSKPAMTPLANSSKPVQMKASNAPISELMGGTALTPKVDRNSPTALRPSSEKQQPIAREPISSAFTQPAARPIAVATRVATAAPAKISSPMASTSQRSTNSGLAAVTSSFTGSSSGTSGSRTATTATSSSAKTATSTGGGKVSSPTVSSPSTSKTSSSTSSGKTSGSAKSSSAKTR